VRVRVTFNAAASFDGTARSTRVSTLFISGTEIYAEVRDWVTVLVDVVSGRRTIEVRAGCSTGEGCASGAASVFIAIKDGSSTIAIVVGGAVNASSR